MHAFKQCSYVWRHKSLTNMYKCQLIPKSRNLTYLNNILSLNLINVTKLLVEIKWCCSSTKKVTWRESVCKCPSIDSVWLPWTSECEFLICRFVFRLGRSWKEASEYFRDANAPFSPLKYTNIFTNYLQNILGVSINSTKLASEVLWLLFGKIFETDHHSVSFKKNP